jgi:hypothetical protein
MRNEVRRSATGVALLDAGSLLLTQVSLDGSYFLGSSPGCSYAAPGSASPS